MGSASRRHMRRWRPSGWFSSCARVEAILPSVTSRLVRAMVSSCAPRQPCGALLVGDVDDRPSSSRDACLPRRSAARHKPERRSRARRGGKLGLRSCGSHAAARQFAVAGPGLDPGGRGPNGASAASARPVRQDTLTRIAEGRVDVKDAPRMVTCAQAHVRLSSIGGGRRSRCATRSFRQPPPVRVPKQDQQRQDGKDRQRRDRRHEQDGPERGRRLIGVDLPPGPRSGGSKLIAWLGLAAVGTSRWRAAISVPSPAGCARPVPGDPHGRCRFKSNGSDSEAVTKPCRPAAPTPWPRCRRHRYHKKVGREKRAALRQPRHQRVVARLVAGRAARACRRPAVSYQTTDRIRGWRRYGRGRGRRWCPRNAAGGVQRHAGQHVLIDRDLEAQRLFDHSASVASFVRACSASLRPATQITSATSATSATMANSGTRQKVDPAPTHQARSPDSQVARGPRLSGHRALTAGVSPWITCFSFVTPLPFPQSGARLLRKPTIAGSRIGDKKLSTARRAGGRHNQGKSMLTLSQLHRLAVRRSIAMTSCLHWRRNLLSSSSAMSSPPTRPKARARRSSGTGEIYRGRSRSRSIPTASFTRTRKNFGGVCNWAPCRCWPRRWPKFGRWASSSSRLFDLPMLFRDVTT